MGESIEHPNPYLYRIDLRDALDAFESALVKRYEAELDGHMQVWTPHGEEPDPKPTASAGPGPDTVSIGYNHAKKNAPSWAAEVRAEIEPKIPEYDLQDLNKIESAFEEFKSAQALLGGQSEVGGESSIAGLVNKINGRSGGADDFAAWAGVSGEKFKNNFGQFVDPTMENQTAIARSLANLYAGRACIVDSARGNSLAALKEATTALGETVDSGAETARWTVVSVASIAIGLASTGVGTAVAVAGLVGQYLDGRNPDQKFANDIEGVVSDLEGALESASDDLRGSENKWSDKVKQLQTEIEGEKSNNLELYDFTGHSSGESGPPSGGFDVDVDYINKLAMRCFEASEEYEKVIKHAIATDSADDELKGKYNIITTGDSELKDVRDALVSFLKTTCARYYEAGSRLNDAARAYYGAETQNADIMKHLEKGPDLNGSDRKGKGGPVEDNIKETDRDDIENWPEPHYPPPGGGPF